MRFRGLTRLLMIVPLAGLALTACATGSTGPGSSPSPGPTGSIGTATTPTPTDTPTSTPTARTTSPVPTRSTTPTSKPTSTAPTLPADYCKSDQLTMRILPGGAEPGYEIAAVTFTNSSSRSCSLSGFPAVELRRGGAVLATAAPRPGRTATLVHLAPGVQAQAQLRDRINCQAPLSDSIHAVAPAPLTALSVDATASFVQMRGCTVTVDPIVLSS